jgi:hypothetical protein
MDLVGANCFAVFPEADRSGALHRATSLRPGSLRRRAIDPAAERCGASHLDRGFSPPTMRCPIALVRA